MTAARDAEDSALGVEIRIHGMGDHRPMDSIGSGPVVASRFPRGPDTMLAPELPSSHELRLLNWSRTSRRHARGAIWFAALPFSLVNVAGQMADAREGVTPSAKNLALVVCVNLVGLLATLTGLFWLLLIAETVLDYLAAGGREGIGQWTVIFVFVAYAISIVIRHAYLHRRWRARRQVGGVGDGERGVNFWLTGLHVLSVLVAGALVVAFPPTRLRVPSPEYLALFTYPRPHDPSDRMAAEEFCRRAATDPSFDTYVNPVNSWIVGSVLLTGIIALVLVALSFGRRETPKRTELAGAAMALSAAMGLMHALGGSLRLAIEWILTYLDRFDLFGWFDRATGLRGGRTYVRGADLGCDVASGEWLPNSFAGLAVLGLLVFAVTFGLTNLVGAGKAGAPASLRLVDVWRYTHRLVASIPSRLGVTVVIAWLLWTGLFVLLALWRARGGAGSTLAVVLVAHAGAIVVVLFLFFNGTARRLGSTVADIIGFWPVRWHPLSGRSYRAPVLNGIRDELSQLEGRRVLLAGHSQGSVIAAWFVGVHGTPERKVDLVTCGSPLYSLYAHFFPAYFDATFFGRVRDHSAGWANFWRETDPVATPITEAAFRDDPLDDPPWGEKSMNVQMDQEELRDIRAWNRPANHGNYWADPIQRGYVAGRLKPQTAQQDE
ncbi:hypothetical protein [Agromyces ramosus]|uniref:Integral membrane protein n=1 Tax=Agromyces ramosus TaxID=33879 RepID=A0ABU0RA65_9MICO|nr:hypothetical protein [Agromyces ramosus]MDQ0894964.1 hypothetical protein [Agromyces ramosus]